MIFSKINKSIPLLFILSTIGLLALYFFPYLPSYTRLAIGILIPIAMFFIFRKEERLDEKKFLVIMAISFIATILWDTIAIKFGIWGFHRENTSIWILGVPLEEYIFGIWLSSTILGIYTSLPHFKHYPLNTAKISDVTLLVVVFLLQSVAWLTIIFSDPASYIKWLIILGAIPSLFYLLRKGETIDEVRLLMTCLIMIAIAIIIDIIFIKANAWYYNEQALAIGRVGIVPIEDLLFTIFTSITIIGIYTSLPPKKMLTGKW